LLVLVDEFFVGIGDINSAFLPKIAPLAPSVPSQLPSSSSNPPLPQSSSSSPDPFSPSSVSEISSETAIHETSPTLVGSDDEELEKRSMLTINSIALEAQVEERPLAKKQEELEEQEQKAEAQNQIEAGGDDSNPNAEAAESTETKKVATPQPQTPAPQRHTAKALLRNDDYELLRVQTVGFFHLSLSCTGANGRDRILVAGSSSPKILRRVRYLSSPKRTQFSGH
jgi:RNA polymerase II subunit A-like phosphatase